MNLFTSPRSYALNSYLSSQDVAYPSASLDKSWLLQNYRQIGTMTDSDSHPNFVHLTALVFEAVLEVVFVALPGYLVARQGHFDSESQKFLANLNVMIFTPCLVFTKLAKQLTAEKLVDLAIIPVIFIVQTIVSYVSAQLIARCFGFKKRPRNFVVAMGVFGNSNSLPISLVISLSKTISGLHWDQIPGDNDNEVAARGILYLLIFQQLGQLLRWTWGFNVLLKPKSAYTEEEGGSGYAKIENGDVEDDQETVHSDTSVPSAQGPSGEATPLLNGREPALSKASSLYGSTGDQESDPLLAHGEDGEVLTFKQRVGVRTQRIRNNIAVRSRRAFGALPRPIQTMLSKTSAFGKGVWSFMNPPLWAMLFAIFVASVPPLQNFFFQKGTFVNNSIVHGIEQSAGVAVPLILVVLGANLARNTIPTESADTVDPSEPSDRKLLIAALLSRMLLPTLIMAPLIALVAKFVPVSIVDDPIFVVVVFLLVGAPSALQLSQICQLNGVYMGAMAQLLFQSYVVWILPSTLMLVMFALEVVKWAAL